MGTSSLNSWPLVMNRHSKINSVNEHLKRDNYFLGFVVSQFYGVEFANKCLFGVFVSESS